MQKAPVHSASARSKIAYGLVIAFVVLVAMMLTNRSFTMLEDETTIITVANSPVLQTLKLFVSGQGQHEHPPLSDIFLHFWIPAAGVNPGLLRFPAIFFYVGSIVILAMVARKIAGDIAYLATLICGAAWPFGFMFGRLAGWYSFCLFLIALLTLAYLRWQESPSWSRWAFVLLAATALLWSNYFGWAIVGLLVLDVLLTLPIRKTYRYLLTGAVVLTVAYGPLWLAFVNQLRAPGSHSGQHLLGAVVNAVYGFFALFVSESIAPWYWQLSLIAGLAMVVAFICTFLLGNSQAKRLQVGFLILFTVMGAMGILGSKRLLFISGWFIISVGVAAANRTRPLLRGVLLASLVTVAVIGWTGMVWKQHYATAHFLEPWQDIADNAAAQVSSGTVVVSNSPSFLFYLNTSLHNSGLSSDGLPHWANNPKVVSLISAPHTFSSERKVLLVRGVNTSTPENIENAERWLSENCRRETIQNMVPDPGFEFKKKYFPSKVGQQYRITTEQFDCSASGH